MSILGRSNVQVHSDAEAASRTAAERVAHALREAVEQRGVATIALSGGSTPEVMYRAFTDPALAIPWERVHILWGDERCVPPAHPRSNFGMAWRAFISRIPIPAGNIHRMRGELQPGEGAEDYRATLREVFRGEPPTFDFVHLGIGNDGHTASLFPFDLPVLLERDSPVCVAFRVDEAEHRLTLTLPAINAARTVEFLALGASKAQIVRTAIEGPLDPFRIPAQLVRGAHWVLDSAATG